MADLAPDWTPYRYGFNNPISYIDPDGLFETKTEAKDFKKEHGLKGYKLRKDKDSGDYYLQKKGGSEQFAYGGASAGNEGMNKKEIFQAGYASNDYAKYIYKNTSIEFQKEFFQYTRSKDLEKAATPIAITLTLPVTALAAVEVGLILESTAVLQAINSTYTETSIVMAIRGNALLNTVKRRLIDKLSKAVWKRLSISQKKRLIKREITKKIKKIRNTEQDIITPTTLTRPIESLGKPDF